MLKKKRAGTGVAGIVRTGTDRAGAGRLTAALAEAARDPLKVERLFKILADSIVTFGGFHQKHPKKAPAPNAPKAAKEAKPPPDPGEFLLMCFQEQPDDGPGEAVEYVPFFSSPALARRLFKKKNLSPDQAAFREAPAREFFKLALKYGKVARLNPGGEFSRIFSAEEMRHILTLGQPPGGNKKAEREEFFRPAAEKIRAARPAGGLPGTLAEVLELAENCLGDFLLFHPQVKADIQALPEPVADGAAALVWRIFISLAQVFHFMRFREQAFSREDFVKETGLALVLPGGSEELPSDPEATIFTFDLKRRDLTLCFSIFGAEEKLLVRGLDGGTLFPLHESERARSRKH